MTTLTMNSQPSINFIRFAQLRASLPRPQAPWGQVTAAGVLLRLALASVPVGMLGWAFISA